MDGSKTSHGIGDALNMAMILFGNIVGIFDLAQDKAFLFSQPTGFVKVLQRYLIVF